MLSDLFTIFDYSWGAGFWWVSLFMWFSGLLAPFFVLCFMTYWVAPSGCDSGLMWFLKLFSLKMPEEVKWVGGTPHLFFSLLFVLLMLNLSGNLPYHYPLSAHFLVVGSFAMPFWISTIIMYLGPNWRLVFVSLVQEGGYLVPNAMVMVSELVSFLARPLTLTCRLVMNIMIGQIIMELIGNVCVSLFLPFFWYERGLKKVAKGLGENFSGYSESFLIVSVVSFVFLLVRRSCLVFFEIFMFLIELAVSFLQACIFSGLLVFYVYETPIKLSEDSVLWSSLYFSNKTSSG